MYGGTPLDDAYRHDQTVAVALLEKFGAVRCRNPLLESRIAANEERKRQQILNRTQAWVQEVVEASDENKCINIIADLQARLSPSLFHFQKRSAAGSRAHRFCGHRFCGHR